MESNYQAQAQRSRKGALAVMLTLLFMLSAFAAVTVAQPQTANAADVWNGSIAADFAGGTGTVGDPYRIATGGQLALLANKEIAFYKKLLAAVLNIIAVLVVVFFDGSHF